MTGSQVTQRLRRIEPPSNTLVCPCGCERPDVGLAVFDDGVVAYCMDCLSSGYACRMLVNREGE